MIDIEKTREIIDKRTKLGTMSRDYGHHVDDILHIEDSYELTLIDNAVDELERLQKKETPIKVIKNGGYDTCPNCKKIVPYEWVNVHKQHCGYCGQKIKYGVRLSKVGEKE